MICVVNCIEFQIDNLEINHDGEIEYWDLSIGGVEITDSLDVLQTCVVKSIEDQVMKQVHSGYLNQF